MKKFLSWAAPALMASVLFVGCQKSLESVSEDGLREGTNMRNGAACADCVSEPVIQSWNTTINNNGNYAKVDVWKTNIKLYIKVTAKNSGGDDIPMEGIKLSYPFARSISGQAANCNWKINYQAANTQDFTSGETLTSTTSSYTYEFELGAYSKCDIKEFALVVSGADGTPVSLEGANTTINTCTAVPTGVSYSLYEICSCPTPSFTSTTTCTEPDENGLVTRTATFVFKTGADQSGEFKIQGGLTNFTVTLNTATVDGASPPVGGTIDIWIPGGSTNRIISATGTVGTCETITVFVSWTSTNTDAGILGGWSVELNGNEIWVTAEDQTCNSTQNGTAPL